MNCLIRNSRLSIVINNYNVFKHLKYLSARTQSLPQEILDKDECNQLYTRVIKKKAPKPPFMKNVFLGKFDNDVLGFPEVLDNEEYKHLNEKVSVVKNYLKGLGESQIFTYNQITDEVRAQLGKLNLFGLQSPQSVDGLELNETENCRILEEVSAYRSLATSLISHQYLGVHAVLNCANINIKNKYLSRLTSGRNIAAFCLLEDDNPDPSLMKTVAKYSADVKTWILNGNKSWVVNGGQSDVYIVVAQDDNDCAVALQDKLIVMMVEKNFTGITVTPCQPVGLEDSNMCHISFKDTSVPAENVLGKGAEGMKLLTSLLSGLRLSTGPQCIALLRKLISKFTDSALHTKHGSKYITETDFIQDRIAEINLDLYAIESMTYLTAGLLDRYDKQDCELESAIIKVFSSERCLESVQKSLILLGTSAYMQGNWLNELYNDALGHIIMNETNSSLHMIIALLGLQHAGCGLNENVKKLRNPFFYPGHIVKNLWIKRRQEADNPKLVLRLEDYLHPSLTHGARFLEYCVLRLQYAIEVVLVRHGPHIMEKHMELRRIADVAIDIYAMTAVLSRASRSYCIGLQNADYEILLASAFCSTARDRVKHNVAELARGPYGTNDINHEKIAGRAFKFNGYYAEHPLTKNF